MNLEREVAELQNQLATVDLLARQGRSSRSDSFELLLLKRGELKVKMYQEPGHSLPHVHVDYGGRNHVATYSIEPLERLVGNLDRRYERAVTEWIAARSEQLLALWKATQEGVQNAQLVAALDGDS